MDIKKLDELNRLQKIYKTLNNILNSSKIKYIRIGYYNKGDWADELPENMFKPILEICEKEYKDICKQIEAI